mgnify:CR=1 FL=1
MNSIMKKLFIFGLFTAAICSPVFAETLKVEALTEFSTAKPVKTMQVKITEQGFYDNVDLNEGYILSGKIVNIVAPKRLKRDARFSFIPEHYTDLNGVTHGFENKTAGKYALPIDKGGLAKNAALTVGSYFVKGLSLGVNAVQGAVENEEGNRLKSAGKNVYDNTPFSYVETGKELLIKKGDKFYLKFGKDAAEDSETPESPEAAQQINTED